MAARAWRHAGKRLLTLLAAGAGALSLASAVLADPTPAAGYTVATFAAAPAGATNPDSIAIDRGHVFVGYGNTAGKTGGGTSTIAEFTTAGNLVQTFSVAGHNDGLKVDPSTHLLWAMQNEDGNAQLAIIDPVAATSTVYNLPSMNNGGGYDDIVFRNGTVYFSVSNPANNPNTDPAIVQATLANGAFTLTPVLLGTATATNSLTGASAPLNLQDPDSMITTPAGDLLLDSQADNELVTISAATQSVSVLPVTVNDPGKADDNLDDTVFARSAQDILLIADQKSNTVFSVTGLTAGQAYSAAPDDNLVGALDFTTGVVTPVVTGLNSPHGMAILPVLTTFGAGLQMIAAPEDFTGVALEGALDLATPKLAVWVPGTLQYFYTPTAPADALRPGQGYWIRLPQPAHLFDQGVPTATGAPAPIPLTPGWNMIGNPFPTAVSLSSLQVQDSGGSIYTGLTSANQAGLVGTVLYSFSAGDAAYPNAYQPDTVPDGVLAPYKGYWIHAFKNCKLLVNAPNAPMLRPAPVRFLPAPIRPSPYRLRKGVHIRNER